MMDTTSFPKRHAISHAQFFLEQADKCAVAERDAFECYLEAAIVFGRTAIHRLQSPYDKHLNWKAWFASLRSDPVINFFRRHRDFILKEGPSKVGQIITFNPVSKASELYYFEDPNTPAIVTVRQNLDALAGIVAKAEKEFSG